VATDTSGSANIGGLSANITDNVPGFIAELALWKSALSNEQNAMLAAGVNPQQIDPDNLVFYAPCRVGDTHSHIGIIDKADPFRRWIKIPGVTDKMPGFIPEHPPVIQAQFARRSFFMPAAKRPPQRFIRGSQCGWAASVLADRTKHAARASVATATSTTAATRQAGKSRGAAVSGECSAAATRTAGKKRSAEASATSTAIASRTKGTKRGAEVATASTAEASRKKKAKRASAVTTAWTAENRKYRKSKYPTTQTNTRDSLLRAFRDPSVAAVMTIDAAEWGSLTAPRVMAANGGGGLAHGVNRGRLPFVEIFCLRTSFEQRGDWGGNEHQQWVARLHVPAIWQARAEEWTHLIMRAALAVVRADNLLWIGNTGIQRMSAGLASFFTETEIAVENLYRVESFEGEAVNQPIIVIPPDGDAQTNARDTLIAAFRSPVVANAAKIDDAIWASTTSPRVMASNAGGTQLHGLHRGRLPFVEVFCDSSQFEQRGGWGGSEHQAWMVRVHVPAIRQAAAEEMAHRIIRAGLAAARYSNLLWVGNSNLSPMSPGPVSFFVETSVTVETRYTAATHEEEAS
jgi:hypothetical protein